MRSMFERARKDAVIMDEWYQLFELQFSVINPFELQIIEECISHYNINRFVDVGFGSGDLTCALRKIGKFHMEALEPEQYFYNKTIKKFSSSGIKFLNIPFETYTADADCLFFRFVLQHFPDKTALCRHSSKILPPNGIVIVIESFSFQSNPTIQTYGEIGIEFKKFYGRGTSKNLENDTIAAYTNAGFSLVQRELLKIPTESIGRKKTFAKMLFSAGSVKAMTSDQNLRILDKLREELRCLETTEASIDYRDILLIFQKKL